MPSSVIGLADLGVDDRLEGGVQGVGADLGHGASLGRRAGALVRGRGRAARPTASSAASSSSRRTSTSAALLELVEQVAQLAAHEVAGRLVAQGDAQGGDLAGEELGVGEVALVAAAVLLERPPGRGRPGGSARAGSAARRTTPAG